MTIVFWDTETTGFPRPSLPLDHESQPYIVQLAAQLCENDGKVISSINLIINNGVEIPKEASEIHGITTEKAKQFGVPPAIALHLFRGMLKNCDLIVAHNLKFDEIVTRIQFSRYKGSMRYHGSDDAWICAKSCTMETATPIVNLPPTPKMLKAGFNRPKSPKLEECIKHFFGEELKGAHDAMIDVEACKRIYLHMRDMG